MEFSRLMIILIVVLAAGFLLGGILYAARHRRRFTDTFEDMEGHEFEYFCAELLRNRGFTSTSVKPLFL